MYTQQHIYLYISYCVCAQSCVVYTAYLLAHIFTYIHSIFTCTYFMLTAHLSAHILYSNLTISVSFFIFCTEKGGDPVDGIYVCLYIRTCVVFVYTYVCMFEYIRTCVCLCVCVCVCVCV